MLGEPGNMQDDPRYADVTAEVIDFLRQRIAACEQEGIPRERLLVDPGFGFAKTVAHNLTLMNVMAALQELALPVLIGISRKSLFGMLLGREPLSLPAAASSTCGLLRYPTAPSPLGLVPSHLGLFDCIRT